MPRLLITSLALIFFSPVIFGADKTKGLDVRLISETTAIAPGQSFTVGLHIHHHKGFHTYWKNPGIVGIPTSLKWKLPPGFTASKITWPYPELSSMAGHPCHGYERDVTLLVTITPPKVIQEKEITLSTTASWMCCSNNCYPDTKKLTCTFVVARTTVSDPMGTKLIQKSQRNVPKVSSDCIATLLSGANDTKIKVRITLPKNIAAENPYLFSFDGQISSNLSQKFIKQSDGSLLLTINRSEFSPKKNTRLPAVIKAGKNHLWINPAYLNEK